MTDVSGISNWRKSSRSNGSNGSCVEVGGVGAVIGVRDTKDRGAGALAFDRKAWATFIGAVSNDSISR